MSSLAAVTSDVQRKGREKTVRRTTRLRTWRTPVSFAIFFSLLFCSTRLEGKGRYKCKKEEKSTL